MVPVFVVIS